MLEIFQSAIDTSGIQEIMSYSVGENTVGTYSISFLLFALLWATIRAFRLVGLSKLRRWAEKTPRKFDDKIFKWATEISPLFFAYLSAVIVINSYLALPEILEIVIDKGFIVLAIYEIMKLIQKNGIMNF